MATIKVTVCDVCEGGQGETTHYTIQRDDSEKVSVDLCEGHKQHIEGIILAAPPKAVRSQPRKAQAPSKRTAKKAPARRGRKVVSMEEVESAKS